MGHLVGQVCCSLGRELKDMSFNPLSCRGVCDDHFKLQIMICFTVTFLLI